MKKIIYVALISIFTFYMGYRIGLVKGNEYTLSAIHELHSSQAAARALMQISELGKMRVMAGENRKLICLMRGNVIDLARSLEDCRSSADCRDKVQADYSSIDSIISDFSKEKCP